MKKYQKILMLSAVILSSTQGIIVGASEVIANNNTLESSEVIDDSSSETSESSSNQSTDGSTEEDVVPDDTSNSSTSEESKSSESEKISGSTGDKESETPAESTTEVKPEQQPEDTSDYDLARAKTLPKMPVNLNKLPVKHPGNSPFKDINNNMFKNNINWIYSRGITTGYTPTSYNPNAKVTRGEMAVFLHRLAGAPGYKPPFNVYTDVTQYKNQILWLTATTVSNGTAPRYNPNGKVTRGQMAAFLHRMAKESGYTATSFKPDADITRGEMAAFLNRFYNVSVGGQHLPPAPQPHAKEPVYYSQLDSRWSRVPLNASNVGVSGCVPTSLAMVLRGSYGQNVDPGVVAKKANTISHESFGLSGKDLINTSKAYGHNVEVVGNIDRAATLLRAGYPLIFYINVGIGHAVVVSDYDPANGRVNVNDPYGRTFYPSGKTTLSELWGRPSQDAMDWNAGRPVFAIK